MATAPHPAQANTDSCIVETENLILITPHNMIDIQNVAHRMFSMQLLYRANRMFFTCYYISNNSNNLALAASSSTSLAKFAFSKIDFITCPLYCAHPLDCLPAQWG